MNFSKRHLRIILNICLSFLILFLSIIKLPQISLGYAQSSFESVFNLQNTGLFSDNIKLKDRFDVKNIASTAKFPDIEEHWARPYIEALASKKNRCWIQRWFISTKCTVN